MLVTRPPSFGDEDDKSSEVLVEPVKEVLVSKFDLRLVLEEPELVRVVLGVLLCPWLSE